MNDIKQEETINESLKFKLNNAFKFLKETSHLKNVKVGESHQNRITSSYLFLIVDK